MKRLEEYIRSIPDFPEEGIIFRDITTVIQDPEGLRLAIDSMIDALKHVKILFLLELAGLKGRERLNKYDVVSLITYEGK